MEKLIKNYFCLIGNFDVARLEKNELCFNIRHDADARGFFASLKRQSRSNPLQLHFISPSGD